MDTRERMMTEKGAAFKEHLLDKDYCLAIREWRRQINKMRNVVADLNESNAVRHERSFLETRFEIVESTFEKLSEFLQSQPESSLSVLTKEFDEFDKLNSEVLKLANDRITDINNDDKMSSITSRSSKSSRRDHGAKSSKFEVAQEVARLKASIK